DPSGPETLREGLDTAISEHRFKDTLFIVFDQAGNTLASSEAEPPGFKNLEDSSKSSPELMQRIAGEKKLFQTVHMGRRKFRSYARKFSVERKDCTLIVLQSLHPQEEFLATLSGTFALVIPLTVILARSGGYFLARRSLSPVTAMGMQAGRIGADNLHERLAVQNAKDELGHL